jgi:nitrite reductase/ring-hydroxylating ferredoxin subunit
MDARRIVVCRADALAENQTVKFRLGNGKDARPGFVIRHRGEIHAYRNECRHIPMEMDWVENRFLSRDGCYLQCATHGALYEIASGLCIDGPPAGERLHRLEVEVCDGDVVVSTAIDAPHPATAEDREAKRAGRRST